MLAFARKVGADVTLNTKENPDALAPYMRDKGHFDVAFEASGAAPALASAVAAVRPGGIIVQLGLGGDMNVPVQAITAKELQLRGSFRFHEEFFVAVDFLAKGLIDLKPLISATLPLSEAGAAFALANDRSKAMKVQIAF